MTTQRAVNLPGFKAGLTASALFLVYFGGTHIFNGELCISFGSQPHSRHIKLAEDHI